MQTITDIIQAKPHVKPESVRVAVRRAYEKLGMEFPKGFDNSDLLPGEVLNLFKNKGAKAEKVNGSAPKVAKPNPVQGGEQRESVTPEQEKIELERILLDGLTIGEYQKALQDGKLPKPPQSEIKPAVESVVISDAVPEKKERRARSLPEPEKKGINWSAVLSILPLPMLGLAASFGVYFFSMRFVPEWVAIGEAMAFELTYIGLTASRAISGAKYKRARWVSLAAVGVSVIYNTLAAALHLHPEMMDILKPTENGFWPGVGFWVVAMLHGAPLAILGFFISELGFVKQDA